LLEATYANMGKKPYNKSAKLTQKTSKLFLFKNVTIAFFVLGEKNENYILNYIV